MIVFSDKRPNLFWILWKLQQHFADSSSAPDHGDPGIGELELPPDVPRPLRGVDQGQLIPLQRGHCLDTAQIGTLFQSELQITFTTFPPGFFSSNSTPSLNLTVLEITEVFQDMVQSSPSCVISAGNI